MFNGIIYNQGLIKRLKKNPKYVSGSLVLEIDSNIKLKKSDIGESVSCDGVCLTLIGIGKKSFFFYLSKETLKRSNFRNAKIGNYINIEKSLNHGQKVSGHYVQGHVDTTSKIKKIKIIQKTWVIDFEIKNNFNKYLVEKGSISVNGVSLTISKLTKRGFQINVIPHTLKLTNLVKLKKGDLVNIEFDIFSKYLLNFTS
ncbi:MAG: riboflavin synthase [Pelagibacterales bacterium MED-G40]|nr:MAG: riboflavin synthase [Candidatus Pelagibacter sp. TMED203]PDH19508.1 MAG: riboflavin synthase [Pelagibacterales bacterium MED-G40]|tara:strand:- start:10788 stop:11384 length:597 start_codon:yes stop_codon:yes gene_type:complete